MNDLTLTISGDLVDALKLPPEEQASCLRRKLAIRLYQKGLLSFGKVRELSGMTKWEFHTILGEEGVTCSYDLEELETDLATLEKLG